MVRRSVTRLQISGYRFLTRRMEYALVCRDIRMLDDPIRGRSTALAAGAVLAAIIVAACAVLALVRPHGSLGADPVVMVRESGAMYVRVDEIMHPVPNLASARLIAGSAVVPRLVSAAMMDKAEQGPLMGIPGAPGTVAPALEVDEQSWTVCDDGDGSRTTLLVGAPVEHPVAPALLVTAGRERAPGTYLLYAGRRAAVDLRDRATVRALRLEDVVPRIVSPALLDALPESAPINAPTVPGAGEPGPGALREFRIGTLLRVSRAGGDDHYLVLADGVQRVGRVAADLIRFADSQGGEAISDVPAGRLAAVPVVGSLPVTELAAPVVAGAGSAGPLCVRWQWRRTGQMPDVAVLAPETVPKGLELVQADGAGPRVDAVAIPAGRSIYVRAAGIAGQGMSVGPRYLVTEAGVVFGIGDAGAANALGLPQAPGGAPWPLLALLPRGPELSAASATVVRDSVGAPS